MNVYDFDGTIYKGDSTRDFYLFCLKKNWKLIKYWPRQILATIKYILKKATKTEFKEEFYCFLIGVTDYTSYVSEFWLEHEVNIYSWYLSQQRYDDVIISASPEFLLVPICQKLGIHTVLASLVNPLTGKYLGLNCRGAEKVKRFHETFGNTKIDKFYSDSNSDLPLAQLADEKYKVKNGLPIKWIM